MEREVTREKESELFVAGPEYYSAPAFMASPHPNQVPMPGLLVLPRYVED